ncbi:MAG: glucose-6-phosphate dehydrogenase [Planctomycetota bacterium]|jgi:glucose-6-phosphate 1-dehydrogenase
MKPMNNLQTPSELVWNSRAVSPPFVMVIFGVTGDLSQNKLMPSLFSLFKQKQLPEEFSIIGFSRRDINNEDLRNIFTTLKNREGWADFAKHLIYQKGLFEEEQGYLSLIDTLKEYDKKIGDCATRLFYLATPPLNYQTILDFLDKTKLSEGCGQESNKWTKVIVEKPFGRDLETARALDKACSLIFEEKQIFRVDHYLGKETVQNMLAFRFANGIFEPTWNKNYIDHVQISWGEKKGIEERGEFFDGIGLLRDIAQNHLMQLIAAVAMEPPESFVKANIRDARANAIKSIRFIEPDEVSKYVVRGQYEGYKNEKDVIPDSNTETFIAIKFFVDSPRFAGAPFYLRAGKKMPENTVEISIVFKQTCHILFEEYGCPEIGNVLTMHIQPDEGISMRFIAKKPGVNLALKNVSMKFSYKEEFVGEITDAYEKILVDIFNGDHTLCSRSDELDHSWELITKILEGWSGKSESNLLSYNIGDWGPREADNLIKIDGRNWLPRGVASMHSDSRISTDMKPE